MQKVSIIVPVYNAEKTIEKCAQSILSQTYQNIEIIFVNDGSNDRSLELLSKLHHAHNERIKVISQNNAGVANARNNGLGAASGDYIMFVDSDDYLEAVCIEKIIAKSVENDIDITRFKLAYQYCDGRHVVEEDDFPGETMLTKKDFQNAIYEKMLSGIKMNSICRTLYKKKVIENVFFREDMITAEDLIFNIEAFTCANSFLYLPYPYYVYYQSGTGLTGSGISVLTKYKCNFSVSMILLKHLKKWGMFHLKYITMAIFRLLYITLSKIKRSITKNA